MIIRVTMSSRFIRYLHFLKWRPSLQSILVVLFFVVFAIPGVFAQPADSLRIHSELKQILGSGEFRASHPQNSAIQALSRQLESAWNAVRRAWDRFWHWLGSLFHVAGGTQVIGGVGRVMIYLIIVVFLLLSVWLTSLLVRDLLKRWRTARDTHKPASAIEEEAEETLIEPDEYLKIAHRLATQQDYRGAFRALFLSGLMRLDRAGMVRYERARTNGDYLRALRSEGRTALLDTLAPFSSDFERRWYGSEMTSEADYRQGIAAVEALSGLIGQAGKAAYGSDPDPAHRS